MPEYGYSISSGNSLKEMTQKPSMYNSLVHGNTRNESFMEKLKPNQKFHAPKIETNSLKRNSFQHVGDMPQVKAKAESGLEDVRAVKASYMENWNEAKTQAMETLAEVAVDQGHDPKMALASVIPDSAPTHTTAAVSMAVDIATGGQGSLATALQGGGAVREVSLETKKLSPKEIEALLEETQQRLASAPPTDTRAQNIMTNSAPEEAPQSQFSWENLSPEDLGEFLAADPNQEPELAQLNQMIHELEDIIDNNHVMVEAEMEKNGTVGLDPEEYKWQISNTGTFLTSGMGGTPKGADSPELNEAAKQIKAVLNLEPNMEQLTPDMNNNLSMRTNI